MSLWLDVETRSLNVMLSPRGAQPPEAAAPLSRLPGLKTRELVLSGLPLVEHVRLWGVWEVN